MTEILQKEFSRKTFVRGAGGLIVGFSMLGAGARVAQGQVARPFFAQNQVDAWLMIHPDNTATLMGGRVELGQGVSTSLLQIVGEELDMSIKQLKYMNEDTFMTPNIGGTGGSNGSKQAGTYVRAAGAYARLELLRLASVRLGVPTGSLTVKDGVVSGAGRSVTYGELVGDKFLNVTMPYPATMPTRALHPGVAPAKPVSQYTLVGTEVPRIDIPAKVTGTFVRVHQIRVPGMLHARIVRPRGQGAWGDGTNPKVLSVDASSIRKIPGAQVVRKGNFLAVVAPEEYDAIQAQSQLKVSWAEMPTISSSGNLWKSMREHDSAGRAPARFAANSSTFDANINPGAVDAAIAAAPVKVSATYTWPYQTHAHMGPHCCVADVRPDGATILTNSQSSYGARDSVAALLGLKPESVRVKFYEGGGGFGRGGAPSTHYLEPVGSAAMISHLVGKPVRLQYMRWDDFGWQFYGEAAMYDLRAGIDANGKLVGVDVTAMGVPRLNPLLTQATNALQQMVGVPEGPLNLAFSYQNGPTGAPYHRPTARGIGKTLPLRNNYFKTHTLRAPGNVQAGWAFEQMIDELAYAAKMDPIEFRRLNLTRENRPGREEFHGHRYAALLDAVTRLAKWQPRVAASQLSSAPVVTGRGFAFGTYTGSMSAVAASVEVNKRTGKIVVKDLYVAEDLGLTINPEGARNQFTAGAIQSTGRVLHEQIRFSSKAVTSYDWVTYPIMRFNDHPRVHYTSIQRKDQIVGGGGESGIDSTVASIGNAFFDATGVRLRDAPMTAAKVRAVLKAAGVK